MTATSKPLRFAPTSTPIHTAMGPRMPEQAMGSAGSLAIARGIELSVEKASEEEWRNPPEVSQPLIERVKTAGIEVPWPTPEAPE